MKKFSWIFLALLFITLAFWSCTRYKVLRQSVDEFYSTKPVIDAFGKYDVYIHDPSGTYRVGQPSISNKGISGELIPVKDSAAIAAISVPVKAKKEKAHRFDLSFYTDKKVADDQTASLDEPEARAKEVLLKKEDMREVSIKAIDKKKSFGRSFGFLLGLLALVVAVILIVWVVSLGSAASGTASGTSSGNSGGSGSNSNSGGSGSGCYIATMAYGSYDAPEVLVLRKFRDEVLAQSAAGRLFIKVYYRYSPGLVEVLKGHERINAAIRSILSKFVNYLEKK